MKRAVGVPVLALAVAALAAGPAAAQAPPGKGLQSETLVCNGEETTVVHGNGASGWIGGQHAVVNSFTFSGPEGTFTQTFGRKAGLTPTFTCVAEEGPNTFTAVGSPVPPGP